MSDNNVFKLSYKARELVAYTTIITSNIDRFPKKYTFSLADKLRNSSLALYRKIEEASEYNRSTDHDREMRYACQTEALVLCKEMLMFLDISIKDLKLIDLATYNHWGGMIDEIKRMLASWRKPK